MASERKKLKKLTKKFGSEEAARAYLSKEKRKKRLRSLRIAIAWGVGVLMLVGGIIYLVTKIPREPYPSRAVHWHIPIAYNLCGNTSQLVERPNHSLIHGHSDKLVHVEGKIPSTKAIRLGIFFDNIGMEFSRDRIGKYKNGDTCPNSNTPGQIKLFVNGKENTEFREYVLKRSNRIEVVFE